MIQWACLSCCYTRKVSWSFKHAGAWLKLILLLSSTAATPGQQDEKQSSRQISFGGKMYSWSLEAELNQLLHVSCFWLTATWIPLLTLGKMRSADCSDSACTPIICYSTTLNKAAFLIKDTTCCNSLIMCLDTLQSSTLISGIPVEVPCPVLENQIGLAL